jgi:hypothetical protein
MNREVFWRAIKMQGGILALVTAVFAALSLPHEAVADYWPAATLLAWFVAAFATGSIIAIPGLVTALAAAAGAIAGTIVDVLANPIFPGIAIAGALVVAILVFGASSAGARG